MIKIYLWLLDPLFISLGFQIYYNLCAYCRQRCDAHRKPALTQYSLRALFSSSSSFLLVFLSTFILFFIHTHTRAHFSFFLLFVWMFFFSFGIFRFINLSLFTDTFLVIILRLPIDPPDSRASNVERQRKREKKLYEEKQWLSLCVWWFFLSPVLLYFFFASSSSSSMLYHLQIGDFNCPIFHICSANFQ